MGMVVSTRQSDVLRNDLKHMLFELYDFVFYSLVIPIKLVMLAFVSITKKGSQNAIPCVYLLGKCLYLITSILLLVWPFCLMVT